MIKRYTLVLVLLAFSLLHAKIEIISESPELLILEFRLGEVSLTETNDHIYISASGMDYNDDLGAPLLPQRTYYIGVPSDGMIDLQASDIRQRVYPLSKPVLPVPEVIESDGASEYLFGRDEDKYRQRTRNIVEQGNATYFRYNRVIPITIHPFDYNYRQSEISAVEKMTIVISISGNTAARNLRIDSLDLSYNILNYHSAVNWQTRENIDLNYAPFQKSDFWYRFETAAKGMYELSYQQLSELPLEDIDPRTFRIFSTGGALLPSTVNNIGNPFKEVPILITGANDTVFETGDKIIFYGQNRDGFAQNEALNLYYNPYSERTVYWLTFGGSFADPPKRIPLQSYAQPVVVRSSGTDFYHYETESVRKDEEGFAWFSTLMSGSFDTSHTFSYTVNNVDQTKEQTMTIALQSSTQTTHRMSMTVNGITVFNRIPWSGTGHRIFSETGMFTQSGQNNIVLTFHRIDESTMYLDYFRIGYHKNLVKGNDQLLFGLNENDTNTTVQYIFTGNHQNVKVFEINSFDQVSRLSVETLPQGTNGDFSVTGRGTDNTWYSVVRDGEYHSVQNFHEVLVNDLTVQHHPVDALIITPEIFRSYADQLSQWYATHKGKSVRVVDQQDIFNQFNSGMPDPNAIRLYIRYAFYNYPQSDRTSLTSVTLVGSGTIDWRNFSGQASAKNRIMIFQKGVQTSEDFFVDQSGNDKPDISIGRITVENTGQADVVFGKLNNAWNNPHPGLWRNTLLFVADDEYRNNVVEIVHTEDTQEITELMNPAVIIDRVYGIEYPLDSFGNKPKARDDIVKSLNEGRLIWCYIGHGAYDLLGHESYFRTTDVQLLNNQETPTLFIAASCSVAKYQFYSYSSLSERLLWHNNGGSIASLAATYLTYSSANKGLMSHFLTRLINDYKEPGISLMEAKNATTPVQNRYYTYLGDPVLPVHTPLRYNNITIKDNPDSLFAYQRVELNGSFAEPVNGLSKLIAYSSEYDKSHTVLTNQAVIDYTKWGNVYYRASQEITNGSYEAAFVIPGDIRRGDRGRIINYFFDQNTGKDYIDYFYPKILTSIQYAGAIQDTIPPEITLWLDTPNFRNGDVVSPNPVLHARIFDESGINILGELGHKILLMTDPHSSPLDITKGFTYDTGSYQTGTLIWQLQGLSEGEHYMQLIVFDNFNNPAIAPLYFTVRRIKDIALEQLLPYPNPMSNDGYFTFMLLNGDAQITISIYTITGRRIRTIRAHGQQGFNKVYWNGRDEEGSRLANNTYLYKIRARNPVAGKTTEELGKVIIFR